MGKGEFILRKPIKEKSNILIRVVKLNEEGKQVNTRNISLISEQGVDDVFMNVLSSLKGSGQIIKRKGNLYKRI